MIAILFFEPGAIGYHILVSVPAMVSAASQEGGLVVST